MPLLKRHRPRLGLLAIILAAFYLATHALASQSLWYDEAVTAQVAARGLPELTRWTAGDIQPPLYYYVVAGWTRLAGRGEWTLRFPSAVFAVLLTVTCWALARRLFGRGRVGAAAGLLAAGLSAFSPLYVYYAQEARMYTLLTWLGALAGYCLIRAVGTGDEAASRRWWAGWAACAVAALYTHYFAAFLLLAHALYVVLSWIPRWRAYRSRQLAAAGLACLAIVVLYLPWLPAMLGRYQLDRSYWQGALKLDEALRHVAINFSTGAPEAMLESDAARWLPWFGAAAVACAVALALHGIGRQRRLPALAGGPGKSAPDTQNPINPIGPARFLLLTLVVPILSVLLIASRTPKFNPRYLMLASPSYLLIVAGGVAALLAPLMAVSGRGTKQGSHGGIAPIGANLRGGVRTTKDAKRRESHESSRRSGAFAPPASPAGHVFRAFRSVSRRLRGPKVARPLKSDPMGTAPAVGPGMWAAGAVLALAVLTLCGIVSARSIHNWFTDPAFNKAQWRQLAGYVQQQLGPDETVLLVSGHAAPAWDYYAPDLPAVRLPDIDILDVNAVLGFDSAGAVQQALKGKAGAWLVSWQEEAVDPVGFVPYFLARAGTELPQPREFWQLSLRHWVVRPDVALPARPQPQHADGANFAHKIALLGWDEPAAGQITLYWQALNTIGPHDYQVSLAWEDAAGQPAGARWDGRPAGYLYPTSRWQPGVPLFGQYDIPRELPAGAYYVTVAVYEASDPSGLDVMDVADNPAGKRVRLGPIRING